MARPWRAYRSPLPPIHERPTCLEQIDKSLWTLTQPFRPLLFTPTSAQNRMTVMRLSDGNLWVSPRTYLLLQQHLSPTCSKSNIP